jgi:hypothetical protein
MVLGKYPLTTSKQSSTIASGSLGGNAESSRPIGAVRVNGTNGQVLDVAYFFETPHDNKPEFMLDITTYIDESQHSGPGHTVVAGFWGTKDQWESLSLAWKVGLRNRRGLHMKDLHWNGRHSEGRVRDLLARLGPIPYQSGLSPVYGAAKAGDYSDLIKGRSEFEKKLCGYILCLSIIFAKHTTGLPGYARIKIVCEQQNTYEPLARGLFESFSGMVAKDPHNPYFSSIEFVRKNATLLTQPSDFLAFAMGKYLDQRESRKDLWCRPIFGDAGPNGIPGRLYSKRKARVWASTVMDNVKNNRLVGAVEFGKVLRGRGLL